MEVSRNDRDDRPNQKARDDKALQPFVPRFLYE